MARSKLFPPIVFSPPSASTRGDAVSVSTTATSQVPPPTLRDRMSGSNWFGDQLNHVFIEASRLGGVNKHCACRRRPRCRVSKDELRWVIGERRIPISQMYQSRTADFLDDCGEEFHRALVIRTDETLRRVCESTRRIGSVINCLLTGVNGIASEEHRCRHPGFGIVAPAIAEGDDACGAVIDGCRSDNAGITDIESE